MTSPPPPRFPRLTYKSAAVSGRRDHPNPRAATTLGTNNPTLRRRAQRNNLPRLPSTRRSRPARPQHPDTPGQSESTRSSRTIYHATTASARAAEMKSHPVPGFQDGHRDRPSRSGTDVGDVSRHRTTSGVSSDRDEPRRVTRVVVKRRVITGSPVFRAATEEELDEFLRVERFREMINIPGAGIDIPPAADQPPASDVPVAEPYDADRDVCAVCAGQLTAKKVLSKRAIRRMSSLLSRGPYEDDDVLRISEMANMDEYTAVALFLREIRKYKKETLFSAQEKIDRPDRKRKEKKRRWMEEKDVNLRSASADGPSLMRALERQEWMIVNAKKKMQDSARRSRSEVVCRNGQWKDVGNKSDEEEEDLGDSLRILTAIEPVDPTEILDDDEVSRGDSYRNSARRRRRGLRMAGESGILGRLKSFRRKGQIPA